MKDFNQFLKNIAPKLTIDKHLKIKNYIIEDNTTKKTIIRYFILSKKTNNVFKLNYKTFNISKDIEGNFYLPNMVLDCVEKEKDKNIINIHRIKHNLKFLENDNFAIYLKIINYAKYFDDFLN